MTLPRFLAARPELVIQTEPIAQKWKEKLYGWTMETEMWPRADPSRKPGLLEATTTSMVQHKLKQAAHRISGRYLLPK